MRIALAPRVSSEMQAEDGWSFEDQVDRGRAWAEREGHTVTKIYFQPAVSAAVSDRDELLAIVADAGKGIWDALWIRDLMRFTRSPDDVPHLRAIEFRHGRRIFEDGRSITLLTAEGELDVNVRVSLGSYQVAQIRKLTSHGKQARARHGKRNWSTPPTGYNPDETPRDDNADGVRMVFNKYKLGIYSIVEVAEQVTQAGYRTNAGRPFSEDTVDAILRNKWYCGYVGYRGMVPIYTQAKRGRNSKKHIEWTKGTHVPLIDEATWEACERIRMRRSGARFGRATKQHRVYLLQDLAHCAHCGGRMRCHSSKYEKAKYRCTARKRGMPCDAAHTTISEAKLIEQVDARMSALVIPATIKRRIVEIAASADAARSIMAERKRIEGQMHRARQLFEWGDYTDAQYQARRAELSAQLDALKPPTTTDAQTALDAINNQAATWRGATAGQRRTILKTLFEAIMIDVDTERITEWRARPALRQFIALITASDTTSDTQAP